MSQGFGGGVAQQGSVPLQGLRPATDAHQIQQQWLQQFEALEDPRGLQGRTHAFLSIILIAVLATIAGSQGWEDIELYAESHQPWLATFLDLSHGIPHADTYRRVFERLNPDTLQRCFLAWVQQVVTATGAQVIPIDGKSVRGSYDRARGQKALHFVSAWSTQHRLMLGQVKVDSKSNEITAIPALLKLLDISGCIITLDAMGTQTEIAQLITDQGGDYVLSLKANHPTLYQHVKDWFEQAQIQGFAGIEHQSEQRTEGAHHRQERRQVWVVPATVIPNLYQPKLWAKLQSVAMVIRIRHLWNKTTREVQFYLTSLPPKVGQIARAIRAHWGIENQLHWVLDVTFGEDASRIRHDRSAENFALLRRLAISLLNQETSTKRSLRQKAKRAAMNSNYLIQVLASALTN